MLAMNKLISIKGETKRGFLHIDGRSMYLIVTESRNTGERVGDWSISCLLYFEWDTMFYCFQRKLRLTESRLT